LAGHDRYDTWASHGYNSFRMIVDTAVRIGSTDSGEIAAALRADGFRGIGTEYAFLENGKLLPDIFTIIQYNDGYWTEVFRKFREGAE
jgi:ABC-type branched-subunit amino acid transport system substrate-binding protein